MREIKFRAWDSDEKYMQPYKGFVHKVPNGYVLMQYTGLLDKSGKEIYEGDVVRMTTASGTDERVRPVVFIGGYVWRRARI